MKVWRLLRKNANQILRASKANIKLEKNKRYYLFIDSDACFLRKWLDKSRLQV